MNATSFFAHQKVFGYRCYFAIVEVPSLECFAWKIIEMNSVDLTLIIAVCKFRCSFDAKCFVFV